ncbi:MAG: hypothetical protein V1830_04555 [Candidatus Omnitrophota bacterium]
MDNFEQIFKGFINQVPGCEVLEDVFDKHRLRQFSNADYFLKNREIVAELKCLEQDSMPKLQEFVDELKETRGKIFFGEMAFDKYIKDFPDKDRLNKKAIKIVTHALKNDIGKANKQILETKQALGLSNSSGLLIVINVNNRALKPDLARHALLSLLNTRSFLGKTNYNSISACMYISEAHPEFGLLPFIVMDRDRSKSKDLVAIDIKYLEELQPKWAQFRGIPLIKGTEDMLGKLGNNPNLDSGPKKRSDVWIEEYRKDRYMANLSDEEFVSEAAKTMKGILVKDAATGRISWKKDFTVLPKLTHCFEEANLRGLDFRRIRDRFDEI